MSGVVASFAIGDMLMHNRRKRAEWLADQQAQHRIKLDEARRLLASGQKITEDQMLLINQERAAWEAANAQKQKKGLFAKAKEAVFSSVPEEETKGGKMMHQQEGGVVRAVEEKVAETKRLAVQGKEKVEEGLEQVNAKAGEMLEKRPMTVIVGGPLDHEAQAVTDAVKQKSKSWTDWVMRR